MDILDILLDILLKPPQPFIGLFFLQSFVDRQDHQTVNVNVMYIQVTFSKQS